jgi:hypothetical protein
MGKGVVAAAVEVVEAVGEDSDLRDLLLHERIEAVAPKKLD